MVSKYIVYGLYDSKNGELRYIGKSCSGAHRPKEHKYTYRRENTRKAKWLKQIKGDYYWRVLAECLSEEDLISAEIYAIAYYRFLGYRLTNLTDGGDGSSGLLKSIKVKEKISRSTGGLSESDLEEAFKLHDQGDSTRAIGKILNRAPNVVWYTLKRYGRIRILADSRQNIKPPPPRWKIDAADIEEICNLRRSGVSPREISKMFNLHQTRIYQLTKGITEKKPKFSCEQFRNAYEFYKSGCSMSEVSKISSISVECLTSNFKRMGWAIRSPGDSIKMKNVKKRDNLN